MNIYKPSESKEAPWDTYYFLEDHNQTSEYGYAIMEGKILSKSTYIQCTQDELVNAAENNKDIYSAWTPYSNKLIPLETISFLSDVIKRKTFNDLKAKIKEGYQITVFFGILTVIDVFVFKDKGPSLTPLLFLIFGVIPVISGRYELSRLDNITFEDRAYDILYNRWIGKKVSRPLIAFCIVLVLIAILQFIFGLSNSVELAGLVKEKTWNGEYFRVVTATLLHGGILHIIFNGLVLFSIGQLINAITHFSLIGLIFTLSAIVGSIFSLFLLPDATSVGASGGILGCIGFLLIITYYKRKIFPKEFFKSVITDVLIISLMGIVGYQIIDNAAHLGGFLTGCLLGFVILRDKEKTSLPFKPNEIIITLGYLSWLFLILASLFTIYKITPLQFNI